MLPNHAPLAVAERFGMLEALHPNRIDLGLGRAPGTDMRTAMALRSTSPERFEEQFEQLRGHLAGGYGGMRAVAGEHTVPQLWMLGSTDGGARIAAALGMPFVFAHHFHPQFTEPALELYRSLFRPSDMLAAPRAIVAAGIVVGDDDEEAARRALPGGISMLRLRQGRPAPIPSVEDAEAQLAGLGPAERDIVDETIARAIVGSPGTVHAALVDLAERTGADELMLTSQVADPHQRERALERVAQAFELAPQASRRSRQLHALRRQVEPRARSRLGRDRSVGGAPCAGAGRRDRMPEEGGCRDDREHEEGDHDVHVGSRTRVTATRNAAGRMKPSGVAVALCATQ